MLGVDDRAFLDKLEACELTNAGFGHYDHLRAAWSYIQCLGVDGAIPITEQMIRRFASRNGHPEKFHVTLTTVWVRLVGAHAVRHPYGAFDAFITEHDQLLDKDLPLQFYSREQLFSDIARARWVEPDVRALPRP
jgi:hypothetical protein